AEALAAALGDPRFDPHGDPIPMATGVVPPARGVAVAALEVGDVAESVHVEDEPEVVFAQLAAAGLAPGLRVRVLENSPRRIRLEAAGEEVVLAPIVAANLSVLPIEVPPEELPVALLASLAPGERAEVLGISGLCSAQQRRRLLDLGVVPGTVVENELTAPSGDPTAYRIRGALIALRREQAELVQVHRVGEAAS
ncbi:MAG TPA: FeoA domain-containing protein, partial [Thermoanaerobaculia bacterium]|nr:FeoA domain-containing protein [Thermoanaerobaculia bacterium]